jgi:transketolase
MGFVAINDIYAKSGKPDELLQKYGLTAEAIQRAVKATIGKKPR